MIAAKIVILVATRPTQPANSTGLDPGRQMVFLPAIRATHPATQDSPVHRQIAFQPVISVWDIPGRHQSKWPRRQFDSHTVISVCVAYSFLTSQDMVILVWYSIHQADTGNKSPFTWQSCSRQADEFTGSPPSCHLVPEKKLTSRHNLHNGGNGPYAAVNHRTIVTLRQHVSLSNNNAVTLWHFKQC